MKKQNESAFTLVELIVVITILAILGTIAFISLQGYSSQARDSKRLSDIANIKKSLELFSLNTGKYPEPDDYFTVSYGSQDLRYQGTIGEQVAVNLSRNLNEKPTDPLTENEYTYSRTYAGNEYELLSIYESDLISMTSPLFFAKAKKSRQPSPLRGEGARSDLFSSSYAANSNYPKINGNYNGVYLKAGIYYLPTPSIINALNTDLDLETQTDGLLSQIITGGDNNIANAGIEASTGGLTGMSVEIFTGILDTDIGEDDNNNKEELAQALIDAYSGTSLANAGVYKTIVETASEDLVSLVDTFVLNKDNFVNTTTNTTTTYSCTGTLPSQNVSTSNDTGLTADTTWQNTASGDNCYYECTGGYTGDNCDVEPALVTSTDCSDAGWYWVNDTLDTMGDGYCISPRIEGNGDTYGISWNDTGTSATRYLWNATGYSTTEGLANDSYGITAYLSNYTCGALDSGHTDVLNYGDTIKGRMKWLTQYANTNNNYAALNDIDWINITLNTSSVFPIPSIYIADCIDGVKDLTTDMILGAETITWSNYTSTTDSDATRTARNKYLLGWAKTSGSHLPSAYSSIDYEVGDNLTGDARGEYQVACEAGKFGTYSGINQSSTNDQEAQERIWTSAIGYTPGTYWGRGARIVGYNGCGDQVHHYAGYRNGTLSARFVVRP